MSNTFNLCIFQDRETEFFRAKMEKKQISGPKFLASCTATAYPCFHICMCFDFLVLIFSNLENHGFHDEINEYHEVDFCLSTYAITIESMLFFFSLLSLMLFFMHCTELI